MTDRFNSFTPSFEHFHNDVERYLKSEGKCETNEHGQMVFRGYQAGFDLMFGTYLEHEAFAPLVAEFRKWNWEWNYDDYLWDLTAGLQRTQDWPRLKELWTAVVAKRRTNYNKTKTLLLDSLRRLQQYASEFGHEADVKAYVEMMARVEKRMNA